MPDYAFNKKENMYYRVGERVGFFMSMSLFTSLFYFLISKITKNQFKFDVWIKIIASLFVIYLIFLAAKQAKNILSKNNKQEKLSEAS